MTKLIYLLVWAIASITLLASANANARVVCGLDNKITSIQTIQGTEAASGLVGKTVNTTGIVTGVYPALNGYFIQQFVKTEHNINADKTSNKGSLGLWIEHKNADVKQGQQVSLTGSVDEFFGKTRLKDISNLVICQSLIKVKPTNIVLPLGKGQTLEQYEGMLISFSQPLIINDNKKFRYYGELTLGAKRFFQYTHLNKPSVSHSQDKPVKLMLDDGDMNRENIDISARLSMFEDGCNGVRIGNSVTNMEGILDFNFNEYRLYPSKKPKLLATNPRTTLHASDVGSLRLAAANVENYFNGHDVYEGGLMGFPAPRGASSAEEFKRQHQKIVSMLKGIDGDVVGLIEIENDVRVDNDSHALSYLVNSLNEQYQQSNSLGSTQQSTQHNANQDTNPDSNRNYRFVHVTNDMGDEVGRLGTNLIRVAIMYDANVVKPVASAKTVTELPFDQKSRAPLFQTFESIKSNKPFSVVVNHFKSKGRCPKVKRSLDKDMNDGQGCWTQSRTQAAEVLTQFIKHQNLDHPVFILGDMNAYPNERPIQTIVNAGYTDLVSQIGEQDYSYVYRGQAGLLDYIFVNDESLNLVKRAQVWHINADEPRYIDYNLENKSAAQQKELYNISPFRASDHDPIIVDFSFD